MSGEEGRKISIEDVDWVHNRIEDCLQLYMNKKEVEEALLNQCNIEPCVTELVWQRLKAQNEEFFNAYYLRLVVIEQIMEFNKLLLEQAKLMHRLDSTHMSNQPVRIAPTHIANGPEEIPHIPMSNGSHIPSTVHQNSLACTLENVGPSLKSDNMQHPVSASLANLLNNCGSSVGTSPQKAVDTSSNGRNVGVPGNMMLAQNSNRGMARPMGGRAVKLEHSYGAGLPFEFGAHNNLVESRSAMGDPSVLSFSNLEPNSHSLNGTLLDSGTSPFGLLGQVPENMPLLDLGADFSNGPDYLESYARPSFFAPNTSNFLEPHNATENQGDITMLNTTPERLR